MATCGATPRVSHFLRKGPKELRTILGSRVMLHAGRSIRKGYTGMSTDVSNLEQVRRPARQRRISANFAAAVTCAVVFCGCGAERGDLDLEGDFRQTKLALSKTIEAGQTATFDQNGQTVKIFTKLGDDGLFHLGAMVIPGGQMAVLAQRSSLSVGVRVLGSSGGARTDTREPYAFGTATTEFHDQYMMERRCGETVLFKVKLWKGGNAITIDSELTVTCSGDGDAGEPSTLDPSAIDTSTCGNESWFRLQTIHDYFLAQFCTVEVDGRCHVGFRALHPERSGFVRLAIDEQIVRRQEPLVLQMAEWGIHRPDRYGDDGALYDLQCGTLHKFAVTWTSPGLGAQRAEFYRSVSAR
jgi:hypothetical protein